MENDAKVVLFNNKSACMYVVYKAKAGEDFKTESINLPSTMNLREMYRAADALVAAREGVPECSLKIYLARAAATPDEAIKQAKTETKGFRFLTPEEVRRFYEDWDKFVKDYKKELKSRSFEEEEPVMPEAGEVMLAAYQLEKGGDFQVLEIRFRRNYTYQFEVNAFVDVMIGAKHRVRSGTVNFHLSRKRVREEAIEEAKRAGAFYHSPETMLTLRKTILEQTAKAFEADERERELDEENSPDDEDPSGNDPGAGLN
jgi:hypothetical protein